MLLVNDLSHLKSLHRKHAKRLLTNDLQMLLVNDLSHLKSIHTKHVNDRCCWKMGVCSGIGMGLKNKIKNMTPLRVTGLEIRWVRRRRKTMPIKAKRASVTSC